MPDPRDYYCKQKDEVDFEIEERIKANQESNPEELEEVRDFIEYAKHAISLLKW